MLNISGIVTGSIVDGPGLRAVVFCQGCPHHCEGCHNPGTWEPGKGTDLDTGAIVRAVRADPLCKGVTFSGGEPFAQAEGFLELAAELKRLGYEVAAYSGYTYEEILRGTEAQRDLLGSVDVLVDGPFRLSERSLDLPFKGSRNQRTIDVRASLASGQIREITSGRWACEY